MPDIIETRGWDYEYSAPDGETCMYVWQGQASCLIACYLVDLGLPLEAFQGFEGKDIDDLFLSGHLAKFGFTAENEAILALGHMQNLQDSGHFWGDAYDHTFDQ